jgi:hypothetical protein
VAALGSFNRRGISGLVSDITSPPAFGMPGESLTAGPEPSWRQKIAQYLLGDKKPTADRAKFVTDLMGTTGLGESGLGLIDLTPAGPPLFGQENPELVKQIGDVSPALGMATVLPIVPGAGKAVGAGAKTAKKVGGKISGLLSAAPKGRRAAITATNLRQLPFEEAAMVAESEQHIIPKVIGSVDEGGFVGAPAWVRTRDDLIQMRAKMDEQIESGISGGDWYPRAQAGIAEIAGSYPAKQHLLSQEIALTSAQANPDTNLGFVLSGHNAYEAGAPVTKGNIRTGQQARTYIKGRAEGEIGLGRKTGIYGQHLDPTMEDPATGTNDIWHARLFGYTNPGTEVPFNRFLSAQQHAFMDAETILAVQRANARKMGGRSDWTAGEIQAAPWVAGKARGLMEKYPGRFPTFELAMAEASKTYPDFFNKYAANATYEMTPGRMTGHHPALVDAPLSERMGFSTDPRAAWTNEEGRDIIYDALGMYQRPTQRATGVYQPPTGGPLENNPAFVARPMVGFTGKTGNREVDPSSAAMMSGAEAARAVLSGQGAGAWSKPVYGNKPSLRNAITLTHDKPLTPDEIAMLKSIGMEQYGAPDVVDYGKGAAMASFGGDIDQNAIRRDLMWDANMTRGVGDESILQDRFRQVLPGTKASTAHMQGDYLGFEDAWTQGEGSGAVTRQLQEYLTRPDAPQLIERLDASPELRQKALQLLDQSNERWAMEMDPARRDLQNLRQIFADSGFVGVFDALKKGGVALPVAALILGPAISSEAQGE